MDNLNLTECLHLTFIENKSIIFISKKMPNESKRTKIITKFRIIFLTALSISVKCIGHTIAVFVADSIGRTAISALLHTATATSISGLTLSNAESIHATIHSACFATVCQ